MNKTAWIAVAVTAVLSLVVGFGSGWYSYQAYLAASFAAAFEEIDPDYGAASDEDTSGDDAEALMAEPGEELLPAVAMGESATDGIWDITVTKVKRVEAVNGSYSNAVAADGFEFLIVTAELTNVSMGPQMPDVDSSQVVDGDGRAFGHHSDASLALDDDDVLYTDVNPDKTVTLPIPFEVPVDVKMDQAHLTGTWDDTGKVAVIDLGGA